MNSLKQDLKGKRVILRDPPYPGSEADREFFCEGGFGCRPFTIGSAIYGRFVKTNVEARVSGYEVEKLSSIQPAPFDEDWDTDRAIY